MQDAVHLFDHLTIITESTASMYTIDELQDAETNNQEAGTVAADSDTEDRSDPRKPEPTEIPPRQDEGKFEYGGEHMASLPILRDSLKYYEKARRIYERNKEAILKFLTEKQPKGLNFPLEEYEDTSKFDDTSRRTSMVAQTEDESDDEESNKPEEQEDLFLDFIGQILKNINNLLNIDNYHYDSNWRSMVHELDIDEGFFFLNLHKIHEGGELYEFLMTAGRHFGEYRICKTYHLCTDAELARFRKTHFGRFEDFTERTHWNRLYREICRESRIRELGREEVYDFREYLLKLRNELRADKDHIAKEPVPDKPYLPYVDDIIKATLDSDIQRDFFIEEITALAQNGTHGGDMISSFLKNNNLEGLWFRLQKDIQQLGFIYQGRQSMDDFLRMRTILQNFRDFFFVVNWNVTAKDGGVGYTVTEEAYANAEDVLEILALEDEEERMEAMALLLDMEVVKDDGISKLAVPATEDTENDNRSDYESKGREVDKKPGPKTFVSEDSDQVTVIPANPATWLAGRPATIVRE
ncbi:hypothetical protein ABW21_db0203811 [Orbilia brochopaga]|nr:hypothetical protein ABW21_db0203811 [Drechslerella brochopaga]